MCGRYTWSVKDVFEFQNLAPEQSDSFETSFNRAPGQIHPTIRCKEGKGVWTKMWWGRSKKSDYKLPINARSESVQQKPSFKQLFRNQRCLVPADGFFEWQVIENQKYPHFIYLPDSSSFALAGIWKEFPVNEDSSSCFSILTRSAPSNLLHLHHRVPLVVKKEHWKSWLSPNTSENILQMIIHEKNPRLTFHQVDSRVNSPKNNYADLLQPKFGKQATLF